MNIVLLGATGKTGSAVLSQALEAGNSVTAVVRSPSKLTVKSQNLRVVQGNATDVQVLSEAMTGNEVLISTLGSMKDASLIARSTKAIIAATKAAGLKRVIMMSSFAVKRDQLDGFTKFMTGIVMKKAIADKSAGEAELRASGLDWTIVYATALTDDGASGAQVVSSDQKLSMKLKIARADVAAWMLHEAKEAAYVGKEATITQ